MKKSYLALIISAVVLLTTGLWFLKGASSPGLPEVMQFGIIVVLSGFGIYTGITRLKSEKHGEPQEDELSRLILQKTASASYYFSIYLWLGIMYFSDRIKLESHSLIGAGILGMAVIFLLCWIFFKLSGVKND